MQLKYFLSSDNCENIFRKLKQIKGKEVKKQNTRPITDCPVVG